MPLPTLSPQTNRVAFRELEAIKTEQTRALADASGSRAQRTKRIAEAQLKERVLAADLEHHAGGEKPLGDALLAALDKLRLAYDQLFGAAHAERLSAAVEILSERLAEDFAISAEDLYALASRHHALRRLEKLRPPRPLDYASANSRWGSAEFLSVARRFLAEVDRVKAELA